MDLRTLRRVLLCTTLAAVLAATYASGEPKGRNQPGARFSVVQGKGWSVCESYAGFLNSLPESEPLPSCHLRRNPSLKELDWETLDVHSNLRMVYSLEYPPYLNSLHAGRRTYS